MFKFSSSSSGKAPEITSPLSDISGEKHRSVKLECSFNGIPTPEIRWYRGLKELVDTSKYTIINKRTSQVILIIFYSIGHMGQSR